MVRTKIVGRKCAGYFIVYATDEHHDHIVYITLTANVIRLFGDEKDRVFALAASLRETCRPVTVFRVENRVDILPLAKAIIGATNKGGGNAKSVTSNDSKVPSQTILL